VRQIAKNERREVVLARPAARRFEVVPERAALRGKAVSEVRVTVERLAV
jgi:hypothetical protein